MKISELLLKKSSVEDIHIYPTQASKNLNDKIYDRSRNGVLINPKDESTPMAWDPDFVINGGDFVIKGGVDASGFGSVLIKLPVKDVKNYYDIFIEPRDESADEWIRNAIKEANWEIV